MKILLDELENGFCNLKCIKGYKVLECSIEFYGVVVLCFVVWLFVMVLVNGYFVLKFLFVIIFKF